MAGSQARVAKEEEEGSLVFKSSKSFGDDVDDQDVWMTLARMDSSGKSAVNSFDNTDMLTCVEIEKTHENNLKKIYAKEDERTDGNQATVPQKRLAWTRGNQSAVPQREEEEFNAILIEPDRQRWSNWPVFIIDHLEEKEVPEDFKAIVQSEVNNFYYDQDNQLLYRLVGSERRAFVPWERRADLVMATHIGSAHVCWEEVYRRMSLRVWWPGMRDDIKSWTQACRECQIHSRDDHGRHVEAGTVPPAKRPFGRWSVDWIGPLPETEKGNRWIFTAVDDVTRWPIAVATSDATEATAGICVYDHILSVFGVPDEILSDRGANFLAGQLQSYLRTMEIKHLRTSAYHPRTNGKVESLNGVLGKMLSKAVGSARHKWDMFVAEALFHCRTRKHRSTGFSPYELAFGCQPKLPGDTTCPYVLSESDPRDMAEIRARLLESIGQDRAAAIARSGLSAAANKLRYDRLVREDPLRVGDWVLLRREARLKFQSRWLGPYKVVEAQRSGVYKIVDPSGTPYSSLVHRDRLKRAIVDQANLPSTLWSDEALEEFDPAFGQEEN
jgi:transposase InsO family protein